ncbi:MULTISPECIES: ornithine cyclodeaminase family protein [unclassified Janthinobacterium]|uniref:ornithine cyclodeaminase family protein n=1 Tax=unclassified Janthinobacterium TaxID=2610881 RepID=UPI0016200ACF|nr:MULTISPECIES: ornithine cyclodeaminase family protein [unclassified Janthinobacterium]MBB5610932.1 1-pyrroline-2-carboxylate reductase [NAD(P)H] [Janthinobacterium sp. S3T4]MBB5616418.1 1-pyrroline-2-carboxylate reductase [NAD(P)H] [Janthinobacterium sp. S3M3]
MKIIEAGQVDQALAFPALIDALDNGFRGDYGMPPRQVFQLAGAGAASHDGFALLPAWNDSLIGVKAFTYFPANEAAGFASLYSKILLFDRRHGVPLALVDGTSITYWRTAAVSALASRYLSRPESSTLLLLGTGRLAPFLVAAHLSVRALKRVFLWGRDAGKATALQERLQRDHPGVEFICIADIAQHAGQADIIVSATGAATPLLQGAWIAPGCHVDLLGNHSPDRRECDSALIVNSTVHVDSLDNVLREAGEVLIPIAENVFSAGAIAGELKDLCRAGECGKPGRRNAAEITVFKAVGTALSDLLVAQLVLKTVAS